MPSLHANKETQRALRLLPPIRRFRGSLGRAIPAPFTPPERNITNGHLAARETPGISGSPVMDEVQIPKAIRHHTFALMNAQLEKSPWTKKSGSL
jgi:hypothetical protein